MKKVVIKLLVIFVIVFLVCKNYNYVDSQIINLNFILSSSINIFGIALAITAIFFTVIDRYKEKSNNPQNIEIACAPILREMCENVFGILIIIIIMFIASIFETFLSNLVIPYIEINKTIYIFVVGFSVILSVLVDITKSIAILINSLFVTGNSQNQEEDEKYEYFLEECKKLDKKHFLELVQYTKTLIIKQKIERDDK